MLISTLLWYIIHKDLNWVAENVLGTSRFLRCPSADGVSQVLLVIPTVFSI